MISVRVRTRDTLAVRVVAHHSHRLKSADVTHQSTMDTLSYTYEEYQTDPVHVPKVKR
jgi:hypothetical protein